MSTITQTIPAITAYTGAVPDKATMTKTVFANSINPYLNYTNITFIPDYEVAKTALNTFATQVNTVAGEVNTNAGIATTKADLATDYAEKMALEVETGTYSAKEHAIGDLTTTGGSAKAWAIDTASPDGTTAKSAKTWADESALSASEALASENAAAALLDSFDDRYLGAKAVEPTLDNDGNPLLSGALYYNTVTDTMKVYDLALTTWMGLSFIPTDHGGLTGLADDDHTQYHNDTRGDARYLKLVGGNLTGALNEARATVASHATTADIWGALGNQIDFTGTATVTAFPNAPQAGATRELICAGACSFTAGSNMLIDGVTTGNTVTCAANDKIIVRATSTTTFNITRLKADGTAQVSTSLGAGGTVTTVPLTLTSASTAQQSLTASAYNQAVTLPDATTLSEGVNVFGLYNNSPYAILVKDNGGNLLGFISSNTQVNCSLADNTTANGTWNLSGEALIDTVGQNALNFGVATATISFSAPIRISATSILILLTLPTLYGVVYDETTGQFGAATLIRNATINTFVKPIKVSDNVALVVSCTDGSTAMESVVLTIAGTTISVGTATATTLAGAINMNSSHESITLKQIGTSFVIGYIRATAIAAIRALTVTGTTVAVGAENTQSGTGTTPIIYDMGSNIAMILSQTLTGSIYAKPVTISGTTITAGTQATITCNLTGFVCRQLTSGRIAIIYSNSNTYGAIVSISGTVATSSIVLLGSGGVTTIKKVYIKPIGNQLIVSATNDSFYVNYNVLTDSTGTAIAGTVIVGGAGGDGCYWLGEDANNLYVTSGDNTYILSVLKIGISGNNPVVTELDRYTNDATNMFALETPNAAERLYEQKNVASRQLTINGTKASTYHTANTHAMSLIINNGSVEKIVQPRFIKNNLIGHSGGYLSDDMVVLAHSSYKQANYATIQIIKAV